MTNFRLPYQILSVASAMLAASLFSSPTAFAQSAESTGVSRTFQSPRRAMGKTEMAPSIGVRTGIADSDSHYDTTWGYGVEAGFQPVVPFGVAIELSGYSTNATASSPSLTRTELLGKATYNFGGDVPVIRYSYVGGGLGPVLDNLGGTSHVSFGIEPLIGFDIPIAANDEGGRFSLGAAASYLFVNNSMPDVFSVDGVAKYWF